MMFKNCSTSIATIFLDMSILNTEKKSTNFCYGIIFDEFWCTRMIQFLFWKVFWRTHPFFNSIKYWTCQDGSSNFRHNVIFHKLWCLIFIVNNWQAYSTTKRTEKNRPISIKHNRVFDKFWCWKLSNVL